MTRVIGDALAVTFDDGRTALLVGDELSSERLDHAYAITVHRTQGATVDTAHLYADGGGSELAYVGMSRARIATNVHLIAEDVAQAADDLTAEWAVGRRRRWSLDVDELAQPGAQLRPGLATRIDDTLRDARIRAEEQVRRAITCHDQRGGEFATRLAALETGRSAGRGSLGL